MRTFPFEAPLDDILKDPERYVDSVFSCLESEFLVMPKGVGFVEYPMFERGYEALKAATKGFTAFDPKHVFQVAVSEPIAIVVLRAMLGFTPPEWGYVTTQRTGINVNQGFVRTLDRKVRIAPETPPPHKRSHKGKTRGVGGNRVPFAFGGCLGSGRGSTSPTE